MPLKPHTTDPDKMVYVKREYNLPKEWQGLTDEEVDNFTQAVWPREATSLDFIRAIEAKLKEKNT